MNALGATEQLAGKLERLISIELRFAEEDKYLKAINLYCTLLGLGPRPDPYNVKPFYSYAIGHEEQTMELRFVLKAGLAGKKNRVVIYWKVAEAAGDGSEVDAIHKDLDKLDGYSSQEAPANVAGTPNNDTDKVRRSVIEDSSGNQIGLLAVGHTPFPIL